MGWTASLTAAVGNPTKASDYNNLVANVEYLHVALNRIVDTEVTTPDLLKTDITIGEDTQTKINFGTPNEIHFHANNVDQIYLADNIFGPEADSDVDLGTTGVRWKDAFVDNITVTGEVDAVTLDISGNADIDGTLEANLSAAATKVSYPSTVETGTDENAKRVIFVDLDDPETIWDYSQFMQQIQDTSWHDELGDPPVHGLMWWTEDGSELVWWNRETGAIYMQFSAATNNALYAPGSGDAAGLTFLDGVIYASDNNAGYGLNRIDLLRDQRLMYFAGAGPYLYPNNLSNRNAGSGTGTILGNAQLYMINATVNDVVACRDIDLTDEFGRPKHWWIAGTSAGLSTYNPYDDAIYDSANGEIVLARTMTISDKNIYFWRNYTGAGAQDIPYWFPWQSMGADGWNVAGSAVYTSARYLYNHQVYSGAFTGAKVHGFSDSQVGSAMAVLEGKSLASVGADQMWAGCDEGIIISHMYYPEGMDGGTGMDAYGGLIRLHEDYASPYMKGDIKAAWPLHSTADVSGGGTSHTLTNNNTVTFSNGGPAGSYGNFVAASSQSLTLADHADFAMPELTVACWIYRDIDSGTYEGLVGKYDTGTAGDQSFLMYINTNDTPIFTLDTSGGDVQATTGVTIALAQWYYLVGTWDGTTVKLWINGELVGSNTGSGTIDDSAEKFIIGGWTSGDAPANFFDGRIGGVSVSGNAMTEREIKAEYQRGIRRINSSIDTNSTISDSTVVSMSADPNGRYVAVMGADKKVYTFDEFAVPIATDTYPGTTARSVAVKSMPGGADPHLVMAGSDQIEIVQPDPRAF